MVLLNRGAASRLPRDSGGDAVGDAPALAQRVLDSPLRVPCQPEVSDSGVSGDIYRIVWPGKTHRKCKRTTDPDSSININPRFRQLLSMQISFIGLAPSGGKPTCYPLYTSVRYLAS